MMSHQPLETDYLIIGSGAMGLAFADAVVAESNATIIIVDRHGRPGGHWTDAYSFVRLHQPSAFYGVNSLPLGDDARDDITDAGLYERASGQEICAYFDRLMHKHLLPTGRVRYFPSCDYVGNRRFVSLLSGNEYEVTVRKAVVDATYTQTDLPSTRKPTYRVADGVRCVPVNELVHVRKTPDAYVVIGGGKTSMDACSWLLENGVDPNAIRWIRPRDPWLVDRVHFQPGELLGGTLESLVVQMEIAARSEAIDDLFARLEDAGQFLRLDDNVTPTMYHCAIVSRAELADLRRIKNVVRLGRVQAIERDQIVLEHGTVPTGARYLYVDCSAKGIKQRPALPVFGDRTITLQAVRPCQPAFSAALIGHLEVTYDDVATKNALCPAVPYPETSVDWARMVVASAPSQFQWSQDKALRDWIERSRLNFLRGVTAKAKSGDAAIGDLLRRFREAILPAVSKLRQIIAETTP